MLDGKDRLQAWTLMDELVLDVYAMTRKVPADGAGEVLASMRSLVTRAALRIVQSVSGAEEGLEVPVRSALGMLSELRYYLYLARRLGLIDLRQYRLACARHERVQKCLRELQERSASNRSPRPGAPLGGADDSFGDSLQDPLRIAAKEGDST